MKKVIAIAIAAAVLSGCQTALSRACGPEGSPEECQMRKQMIFQGMQMMNQPQPRNLNCTTSYIGNQAYTNCY